MIVNCVNPPQPVLREPDAYVHLGLLYLAASLESRGHVVRYVDLSAVKPEDASIPGADAHLFTVNTALFDVVSGLTEGLGGFKVAGGVHPTMFPSRSLDGLGVDCVVRNEADLVIADVIENKRGGVVDGGIVGDLDSLPFPARHLASPDVVRNSSGVHGGWKGSYGTHLITSRGCPFSCAFCCRLNMVRSVRFRSAESVAEEVKMLRDEFGIHNFRFCDDNFSLKKSRVLELCRLLKPLDVRWLCITRADELDSELLRAMRDAGCRQIDLGVESGSQRILDLMNKRSRVEDNVRAVRMIESYGIEAKAFLMLGFPSESDHDIELTLDFMRRARPSRFTLNHFVPLPGSDVFENPERFGWSRSMVEGRFKNYFFSDEDSIKSINFREKLLQEGFQNG